MSLVTFNASSGVLEADVRGRYDSLLSAGEYLSLAGSKDVGDFLEALGTVYLGSVSIPPEYAASAGALRCFLTERVARDFGAIQAHGEGLAFEFMSLLRHKYLIENCFTLFRAALKRLVAGPNAAGAADVASIAGLANAPGGLSAGASAGAPGLRTYLNSGGVQLHPLGRSPALDSIVQVEDLLDVFSGIAEELPVGKYFSAAGIDGDTLTGIAEGERRAQTLGSAEVFSHGASGVSGAAGAAADGRDGDDSSADARLPSSLRVELLRAKVVRAYLEELYAFCRRAGGNTWEAMRPLLNFEADRHCILLRVNLLGQEVTPEEFSAYFPRVGELYPFYQEKLAAATDFEGVRAALSELREYSDVADEAAAGTVRLPEGLVRAEAKLLLDCYRTSSNLGCAYAYLRMREIEVDNICWIYDCLQQKQLNEAKDLVMVRP